MEAVYSKSRHPSAIRLNTRWLHITWESRLSLSRHVIKASFQSLHEYREKASALANAALTVMRDQRENQPPSDGELIVGVLLSLLEQREDLREAELSLSNMLNRPKSDH
jgi:hypothetical protein